MSFRDEMKALSEETYELKKNWRIIPNKLPLDIKAKASQTICDSIKNSMREKIESLDYDKTSENNSLQPQYHYYVDYYCKFQVIEDAERILAYSNDLDSNNLDNLVVIANENHRTVFTVRKKEYFFEIIFKAVELLQYEGFLFYKRYYRSEEDRLRAIEWMEKTSSGSIYVEFFCDSKGRIK